MSIDRVARRRSEPDSEDATKKKRKLFGSDDSVQEPVSGGEPFSTRRGFLRKDQKSEAEQKEQYGDLRSETDTAPRSTQATYSPHPSGGAQKRRPADGIRRPYDELSMAIKVRNRTDSDVQPGTARASQRPRPSAGTTVVPGKQSEEYPRPTVISSSTASDVDSSEQDDWRGGTWEDSGYSATDEEAHRDRVYNPPNFVVQMLIVMFAQLKLFAKGKAAIVLIIMIAIMPIAVFLLPNYIDQIASNFGATISNAYTGFLLVMLPLFLALFTAKQCGTQIPNEFKERTAYMSIPLPMHRLAFYFGKYLAGFLYCLALFLLAFGVAVACTATKFDSFYTDVLLQAFAGTVVAILVYSSTAFCLGCFLKRGSVLLPLVLNLVALPLLFFYLTMELESNSFLLAPVFLPDAIVQSMGFPMSMSAMGMISSLFGANYGFGDMWTMCGLGVAWGAIFLALGALRMMRREM